MWLHCTLPVFCFKFTKMGLKLLDFSILGIFLANSIFALLFMSNSQNLPQMRQTIQRMLKMICLAMGMANIGLIWGAKPEEDNNLPAQSSSDSATSANGPVNSASAIPNECIPLVSEDLDDFIKRWLDHIVAANYVRTGSIITPDSHFRAWYWHYKLSSEERWQEKLWDCLQEKLKGGKMTEQQIESIFTGLVNEWYERGNTHPVIV